jgi:uncharacterized protein
VTEACASGRPVYVFDLPGGSAKFYRFHKAMRAHGHVRPLDRVLESYPVKRLDEMTMVARAIRERMAR